MNLIRRISATPLWALLNLILFTGAGLCRPTAAQAANLVNLVPISSGLPFPVGLDIYLPGNSLLASVNFPTGEPINFELLSPSLGLTPFSGIHGIPQEVKLATVREPSGGFTVGDVFFDWPGNISQIFRFPAGSTTPQFFADLPIEAGLTIYLYKDTTGIFGGDLIAASATGFVYRITSAGKVTQLAKITLIHPPANEVILEGLTTVPNDPKYGPWAGKIVIAAENDFGFYSIDTAGNVHFYDLGITNPEDIRVAPCGENLFVAGYANGVIYAVSAADLAKYVGDFIVVEELPANVWDVRWDGTKFVKTLLATGSGGQFEQMTFSPTGFGTVPTVTPTITCSLATMMLWPPNHDLTGVGLTFSVCPAPGTTVSVTVYSNEPDVPPNTGDDHFSPDAKGTVVNVATTTTVNLRLRQERLGNGPGRVYLVVVTAVNGTASGFSVCPVVVPHDMSKASINSINTMAANAEAYFLAHGVPPSGYVKVGVGPVIGPKQ